MQSRRCIVRSGGGVVTVPFRVIFQMENTSVSGNKNQIDVHSYCDTERFSRDADNAPGPIIISSYIFPFSFRTRRMMGTASMCVYVLYTHTIAHDMYIQYFILLCVSQSYTTRSDGGGGVSFTPPGPSIRPCGVCIENRGINANLIGVYFNIILKVVHAYLCFVLGVCRKKKTRPL